MSLQRVVETWHENAYCRMMNNLEKQDARDDWIESRTEELIRNFANDNDWQIIELLKIKLESKNIDADIYNQFVTDICYSQAKYQFEEMYK